MFYLYSLSKEISTHETNMDEDGDDDLRKYLNLTIENLILESLQTQRIDSALHAFPDNKTQKLPRVG